MNREKKQLVVVGVLVVLVLGVGAFQFTRKDPVAAPVAKAKPDAAKDAAKVAAKVEGPKYPDLFPLPAKDPFETAAFVAGPKQPEVTPPVPTTGLGATLSNKSKESVKDVSTGQPSGSFNPGPWQPGGETSVKPVEPPKPVFGYTLVGIVEGAHPTAVFDDGKGNQQLVEVGQGIGQSSTVISISRGTVRVKFNAETLNFSVGGNPNAK